jgi:hypothetical protein
VADRVQRAAGEGGRGDFALWCRGQQAVEAGPNSNSTNAKNLAVDSLQMQRSAKIDAIDGCGAPRNARRTSSRSAASTWCCRTGLRPTLLRVLLEVVETVRLLAFSGLCCPERSLTPGIIGFYKSRYLYRYFGRLR